jgi:2-C-methyl-D-erythritol 4-phosphate cytidylyltransferase
MRLGGGTPKALRLLAGKPLVDYSLATLETCAAVDAVIVVVPKDEVEQIQSAAAGKARRKISAVIAGGDRRQDSVRLALAACPAGAKWVAIHDAARPFASADLFSRTIDCARRAGGAIAALPVSDTIKRVQNHCILETLPRKELWRAETPQVFRPSELRAALALCAESDREATDDALAMELAGHTVAVVESDGTNFKISTPADWARAERQLASRP